MATQGGNQVLSNSETVQTVMSVPNELDYRGPNSDLVREVMEFAFSDEIVAGVGPEETGDIIITNDLVRAVDAAGFASDESRFSVAWQSGHMVTPEKWPTDGEIDWNDEDGWGLLPRMPRHRIH